MKLTSVYIRRFRSIIDSGLISLNKYTILIGKNNEGKSNVLNAINLAFRALSYYYMSTQVRKNKYVFDVDYPVELKNKDVEWIDQNPTEISMTFEFSEEESSLFNKYSKVSYSKKVEILISFRERKTDIIVKRRRNQELARKEFLEFIVRHFDVIYIPTIRTSEQSIEIIERVVSNGMLSLRKDEEYNKAFQIIQKYEQDKLKEISRNLVPILKQFLPSITDISIEQDSFYRRSILRSLDLIIDDGTLTSIENKGDGIKSLVQIALLKETAHYSSCIIAIEEPEAHLHSGAIHELDSILKEISDNQQVLVTTHNPIFADVIHMNSNYIVDSKKCRTPISIKELRDTLGVQFSDSLFSSNYVILVEGDSDKEVFSHLLSCVSKKIKALIQNNTISFYVTKGASKASSFMVLMKQLLIKYYVIWDNDAAGKTAYNNAKESFLIEEDNYNFIPLLDKNESELEDVFDLTFTTDIVNDFFNVSIQLTKKKRAKWSDRVSAHLKELGKEFNANTEEKLKNKIASKIKTKEFNDIVKIPIFKNYIESLADSILTYFHLKDS